MVQQFPGNTGPWGSWSPSPGTSLNKKMDIGISGKAGSDGDLGQMFINFANINFRQSFGFLWQGKPWRLFSRSSERS